MNKQKETIKLLIKIQYKGVENFKFQCPLSWTFAQLKEFIFTAHKNKLFRSLNKGNFDLLYAGKLLKQTVTIEDFLEELREYYEPLVMYVHPKHKEEEEDVDEL